MPLVLWKTETKETPTKEFTVKETIKKEPTVKGGVIEVYVSTECNIDSCIILPATSQKATDIATIVRASCEGKQPTTGQIEILQTEPFCLKEYQNDTGTVEYDFASYKTCPASTIEVAKDNFYILPRAERTATDEPGLNAKEYADFKALMLQYNISYAPRFWGTQTAYLLEKQKDATSLEVPKKLLESLNIPPYIIEDISCLPNVTLTDHLAQNAGENKLPEQLEPAEKTFAGSEELRRTSLSAVEKLTNPLKNAGENKLPEQPESTEKTFTLKELGKKILPKETSLCK